MDIDRCFKLNNEYRDVRLSTDEKLKKIRRFIALIQEYQRLHPTDDLSKLKLPHSIKHVKQFISDFDEYDSTKRYAFIRRLDGSYLCGNNGHGSMYLTERPVPLGWEVFSMEELGDTGKIALKSRGRYVSSENGEMAMRCDRENIGEWEKFILIQHGDAYAFQGNNGKLVSRSAETNNLVCSGSNDAFSDDEKFYIEWISDFADEITISWKHYDEYFKKLYEDYDIAIEEKKNIDPDNYYIMNKLEIYDSTSTPNFTHHQQKVFNQKEFKEAVQGFDEVINNVKWIIRDQNNFLSGILWREKSDLDKITKMLNKFAPVIAILDGKNDSSSKKHSSCLLY